MRRNVRSSALAYGIRHPEAKTPRGAVRDRPGPGVAAVAAVLMLVGGLAGCGGPVKMSGVADQVSVINAGRTRIVERLAAMDQFVVDHNWNLSGSGWDVVATSYELALIDGETVSHASSTNAMMGSPAAITMEVGGRNAGLGMSQYHPAGSELDYWLLGESIRDLAPTPWISTDTIFADGQHLKDEVLEREPYTWTFCAGSSRLVLCGVRATLFKALAQGDPDVVRDAEVTDLGMGMTLLSVTVPVWTLGRSDDSLGFPALMPTANDHPVRAMLEQVEDQSILIRMWQTAEGEPVKIEINGELTDGERVLTLQSGWEKKGTATAADFPQTPSVMDVTHMDTAEYDALVERIDRRAEEMKNND